MKDHLIFIADISGFTEFTSLSEINHGAHLVSDLFQVLLNQNDLGLKLVELEGDAVQLVKEYKNETEQELYEIAKKMFLAFHNYLQEYEFRKICFCQACANVKMLSIKFFIHRTPLVEINLQQLKKYFGPGMIAIHRMMKNQIPAEEYILFTDAFEFSNLNQPTVKACADLTYLGEQNYFYLGLNKLLSEVDIPDKVLNIDSFNYNLKSYTVSFKGQPMKVMSVLSDLVQKAIIMKNEPKIVAEENLMVSVGNKYAILYQDERCKITISKFNMSDKGLQLVEYYHNLLGKDDAIKIYSITKGDGGMANLNLYFSLKEKNSFDVSDLMFIDQLAHSEVRQLENYLSD